MEIRGFGFLSPSSSSPFSNSPAIITVTQSTNIFSVLPQIPSLLIVLATVIGFRGYAVGTVGYCKVLWMNLQLLVILAFMLVIIVFIPIDGGGGNKAQSHMLWRSRRTTLSGMAKALDLLGLRACLRQSLVDFGDGYHLHGATGLNMNVFSCWCSVVEEAMLQPLVSTTTTTVDDCKKLAPSFDHALDIFFFRFSLNSHGETVEHQE
ncbi:hypothetical protein L1987_75007 [Smallanthus sonchifolius]|uniref:Uncharacterized protein n=1 Tax=Smallanthus sonchifolius TaxID=185202 RepID=A0ACB9A5X4_9ASTR|nr:hypothetical protein L1987_75007 [Smallanthus sonchifolius]